MSNCIDDVNSAVEYLCKAEVKDAVTLGECHNTPVIAREEIGCNNLLVKIPVVLAEITVQTHLEAKITLNEPAIDIKRIKKNVFLTQCRLVATPSSNKLFLSGFVRKNIEYSSVVCADKNGVSGSIRHTTVDVPFTCVTAIPPHHLLVPASPTPIPNSTEEAQMFDADIMGKDRSEQMFLHNEFFNEKVFCELVCATITELDIVEDLVPLKNNPNELVFQTFTEKIVVDLTLKLLQLQQVLVTPAAPNIGHRK
jgi:hypothetical protein